MSIPSPSGCSGVQFQAGFTQRQPKELDDLESALKTGDISAAQQALAAFQQHAPGGDQASGSSGSDDVVAEISALGQALAAGDLDAARSTFKSLQELAPQNTDTANTQKANPFADDIASLDDALSAGDLSAARDAFARLQDDIKNNPPPPPRNYGDADDTVQSLFSQIADALDSGDVNKAKDAFDSLLEQLQAQQGNRYTSDYSQVASLGSSAATISTNA